MYYLLGYKIMAQKRPVSISSCSQEKIDGIVRLTRSQLRHRRKAAHFSRSVIFNYIDEEVHTEVSHFHSMFLLLVLLWLLFNNFNPLGRRQPRLSLASISLIFVNLNDILGIIVEWFLVPSSTVPNSVVHPRQNKFILLFNP